VARPEASDVTALLTLEHVSKRFGGLRAVDDVSFTVNDRRGPVHRRSQRAGKTTLFNLITGFLSPDTGVIRFAGRSLAGTPPHVAARLGNRPPPSRSSSRCVTSTVLENVMLGAFLHTGASARRRPPRETSWGFSRWRRSRTCPPTACRSPRSSVSRSPARSPRGRGLILLDEVVAGLPTGEALALAAILQRLPERGVAAVAGVEHVMQVVMRIASASSSSTTAPVIAEGPRPMWFASPR